MDALTVLPDLRRKPRRVAKRIDVAPVVQMYESGDRLDTKLSGLVCCQ